ncbi:MAG: hypothetical protein CMB31_04030 [Euryarchaeota archaeon]|nr:hypothetical protein [Euryarchaeota archaeon]
MDCLVDLLFLFVIILVFLTGFLFAPLGLGGGLLFVPILHYVAGLPLDSSTLVLSLFLTGCVSYGSGFIHHREGLIDFDRIRMGAPSALIGCIIGAIIVNILGSSMDIVFKILAFGIISWAILKTSRRISVGRIETEGGENRPLELILGTGFGGMASSVLAIGAGAIYIPVLNQFGGLDSRRAIATSLGLMMVVIPISVITHALLFSGEWPELIYFFGLPLGVISGAIIGAKMGLQLSEKSLLSGFILVLSIVLIRYFIDLVSIIL